MNSEELDYFRKIMAEHQFQPVAGPADCVVYEKTGVRVQTCNSGEAFEVYHGATKHVSPSLVELSAYLQDRQL